MDHKTKVIILRGISTGPEQIAVGTNCKQKVTEDNKNLWSKYNQRAARPHPFWNKY